MIDSMPERLLLDRLPTPIGEALVITDEMGRLRALDWADCAHKMRVLLQRHYGSLAVTPGRMPQRLQQALSSYFAGEYSSLPSVEWRTAGTPFQRLVWATLTTIPPGKTLSYTALAAKIGRPKAVRAVGLANGTNPISVVVPCHRVIGSDGSLTGYGGGIERKRWLLDHEEAMSQENRLAAHSGASFGVGNCRLICGVSPMNLSEFHTLRRFAEVRSGRIAYVEQGSGPVALFLHGVPLNGFHWRHIIAALRTERRCIALDLMALGHTEIRPLQDVSFTAQAQMVAEVLDRLGIEQIDLVANDSGGAVAQIFAANHPHRLRTLTLTNCDVHDNWPPEAILPNIEMARQGTLAAMYHGLLHDPAAFRTRFARAYADPTILTDEIIRLYLEPPLSTPERRAQLDRYWLAGNCEQTVSIEPQLRQVTTPTLIVWALDDVFFGVEWAYWLKKTIRGVVAVTEVSGAKLFFPEDRPDSLLQPLWGFLRQYSPFDRIA
jgi:O-6-methylguanine DNA methyltransferase